MLAYIVVTIEIPKYAHVWLEKNNAEWAEPLITLADFANMVFVEALHDVQPIPFKSYCKSMRARETDRKIAGEDYNHFYVFEPQDTDRKINDCYEVGVETRNEEFLVTYTRDFPEYRVYTYGRGFGGSCENADSCDCPLVPEDVPSASQNLDFNFERMKSFFIGLGYGDYAALLGAWVRLSLSDFLGRDIA